MSRDTQQPQDSAAGCCRVEVNLCCFACCSEGKWRESHCKTLLMDELKQNLSEITVTIEELLEKTD